MKLLCTRLLLIISANLMAVSLFAQTSSTIYGLFRDGNGVKLAEMNTASGIINNISPSYIGQLYVVTGAVLNPYTNTFHYFRQNGISSVDLTSGVLVHNPGLNNPNGPSYFDLPYFNNSDANIYGLARRSYTDSLTGLPTGELFLSIINPTNGMITQISPASIGTELSINGGSVVDPYQMVYYFQDRDQFIGVDMYSGNILSQTALSYTQGDNFDLPAFHCADSTIYGLIRFPHFDTVLIGGNYVPMYNNDSSKVFLGSLDPVSGVVTQISPTSLTNEISVNASSTIDPLTGTFYFQDRDTMLGVNLITGLITSAQAMPTNGTFFDIMRNFQNCYYAEAVRTSSESQLSSISFDLYPNPTGGLLQLSCSENIAEVQLTDLSGKVVLRKAMSATDGELDLSGLAKGVYMLQLLTDQQLRLVERVAVE